MAIEDRLERLGDQCFRRRGRVLLAAVAALLALWIVAGAAGGEFGQSLELSGTESQAAAERLEAAGLDVGAHAGLLVVRADHGLEDDATRAALGELVASVDEGVDGVAADDPLAAPGDLVSDDGTVAVGRLTFAHDDLEAALAAAGQVADAVAAADLPDGVVVELGGDLFAEEPDFAGTGVGLVAAAVVLVVAFGSLLAAGLPIATALLGIGGAVAAVQLASRWLEVPPFAPAAVAMIGLGAGINYALFVVTRYREELAAGHAPAAAVGRALRTAGRAALFAGATVISSLLGLLVVGIHDVRVLALAVVAGVACVLVASLTLLPALLGWVGPGIDRLGLPHRRRIADDRSAFWRRWARAVQRRPLALGGAAALVLVVLAAPVADMRLGIADATTREADDTTRRAHELVAEAFGEGYNGQVLLAVALDDAATAPGEPAAAAEGGAAVPLDGLAADLAERDDVAAVLPPVVGDGAALVRVVPETGPQDAATAALVADLREAGPGADALVGGVVAAGVDFAEINAETLPWFIALVLVLAFALLAVTFRSVLVPLKAVAVNALTVGAAYGVVVAVFQWGWLAGPLGVGAPGPIEPWVPMMLFAITFGLSIDYEVFLLSRVREHYERTGDNSAAVAHGLARSARLIFAAAAIMVCVFGAFALLADRELQILGLGLAAAIAVDATLVRLVLVPAVLELAGDRNWWLPRRLRPAVSRGPGRLAAP